MIRDELTHLWKIYQSAAGAKALLLMLIAADFLFMILHSLQIVHVLDDPLFLLTRDNGYPEFFQYIKEFLVVVLFLSMLSKTRVAGFAIWALLFAYLLFDDALMIHETVGRDIATRFAFTPSLGLRAEDLGQLVITAIIAAVFLIAISLSYVRSTAAFQQATRHLLLLLLALAFFGVFVDMLHIVLSGLRYIGKLLDIVEDGGEMVVMSLITCYAFLLHVLYGTAGNKLRSPH